MNTPLFAGSSGYGTYRVADVVYNQRPARILYGDGNSPQSGLALDDDPDLLFDYNQRFMEIIMSHQPQKLLVIGGGTCTLPTAVHNLFPDVVIDVVEIDALLIELGYEFFNLPKSPRLRPIIRDAYRFLDDSNERYDMIIVDAFSGYIIPPHLLQLNAIRQYKNHLVKDGIVAINFISEYMRGVDQNYILAAGDGELHFDFLQSVEVEPL